MSISAPLRMSSVVLLSSLVLLAACPLWGQDLASAPASPQESSSQQPGAAPQSPQQKPEERAPEPPAPPSEENPSTQTTVKLPGIPENPKAYAWGLLATAASDDKTGTRAAAINALGLLPNNPRALRMAEKALEDDKPEVRTAAATALGEMHAKSSIPKLKKALSDKEPSVAVAAAHSLEVMHDDSAYQVYYEILTGERKAGKGMVETQAATLKDPKKLAQLGFEEGIGFVPFAGMGWGAYRRLTKNNSTPIRAEAAKVLAKDSNPASGQALADAASHDKDWIVRAAALGAIAQRGDPSLLQAAELDMNDDKDAVQFTAAAATLHLIDVQRGHKARKKK